VWGGGGGGGGAVTQCRPITGKVRGMAPLEKHYYIAQGDSKLFLPVETVRLLVVPTESERQQVI